jgi:putative peptidoglycan lipid II flippase
MVKRILTFFNKEFHGVNEAALLLGGFAFVSQLLGLIRDRTLAHIIGPGPTLDIYYAAFRIPDFLYLSIASLASITVLMPFLVERMNKGASSDDNTDARRFLNNVFSAYMIFMVGISILVGILMPYIAHYIAPGFAPWQIRSLVTTSRIMLLSPIFIGLSNLIGTITQIFKNFFIFSLSPIFYNVGILFGVFFLYPHFGVYGLGSGVILGALLYFLVQVPIVMSHGFLPRFSRINWKEIWSVVKLSAPRTLTLSCNSLAFIVLISILSELRSGSISLFTFAYNIQSDPVAVIGISYSVAAFPTLVQSFSRKDTQAFLKHIIRTSKQILFWALPAITLVIVLRAQIVRVILGSNTFSWSDTRLTAASVAIFMVSLITQSFVLLFVRGYYAAGNTKKPLLVNVFSSLMMIIFAYLFITIFQTHPTVLGALESVLKVHGLDGTIMLALPLAYTLSSILNFILIWILFNKDFLRGSAERLWPTFVETGLSALVMGVVAYGALDVFDNVFSLTTGKGVFLQGLCSGIVGIMFGICVLYLMKNEQLTELFHSARKKFWLRRVVVPEQKEL